jgi:uncharacterized membrane protein
MNLIQNERIKLLATALNNLGVAILVTALIAPAATFLYGIGHAATGYWWLISSAWLLGGVSIHLGTQFALGRLRP